MVKVDANYEYTLLSKRYLHPCKVLLKSLLCVHIRCMYTIPYQLIELFVLWTDYDYQTDDGTSGACMYDYSVMQILVCMWCIYEGLVT